MKEEEGLLDLIEDTFTTMIVFFVICGFFIAILVIVYHLLKWAWQIFEWSLATQSNFRWLVLAPILIATSPVWLSWLLLKELCFHLFRLFLRVLIVGRKLLH